MAKQKIKRVQSPAYGSNLSTVNRLSHIYSQVAKLRQTKNFWEAPLAGCLKINFDSTFSDAKAVTGIVVHNCAGSILFAWTGCFAASTPFAAEAIAALQAMKLAENQSFPTVIFEGDAATLLVL